MGSITLRDVDIEVAPAARQRKTRCPSVARRSSDRSAPPAIDQSRPVVSPDFERCSGRPRLPSYRRGRRDCQASCRCTLANARCRCGRRREVSLTVAAGVVALRLGRITRTDRRARSSSELTCEYMRIDSRTELVVAADIAERLGISRARVSVLVGRPGFPRSLGRLGRSEVWRWVSVERWARETGRLDRVE